ncbi:AAA family ATPase [Gracilibacillus salitolerans]|uniref:AAA family ATPase n=1 Tax=Gracilibacillus salitolerans TaxID=2663022 RepID=A0A5Q2THH4_9BACI|nr:sigma-54-dependent Fis family transcriptional regulator [Gracilibacillus salitolerans]QGH33502.1 AAA family ATPase [Gracilibacillus salitolerans]
MKKINVLVVAPYHGLVELLNTLKPQLKDISLTIEQGDLEESISFLQKSAQGMFDFIISRGGTANLIRRNTTIPVVDIHVSGYDVLRILTLLKGYQSSIAMVGFPNVIQSFESVSSLIDIDISYHVIHKQNDVQRALEETKAKGVKVVVGDTITVRLANQLGLQGVLITSGKESVMEAFHSVRQMHQLTQQFKAKTNLYEQTLSVIKDGIAIVDEQGLIKYTNNTFRDIVGVGEDTLEDISLFHRFPYLQWVSGLNGTEIKHQLEINRQERYEVLCLPIEKQESQEDLFIFELIKEREVRAHRPNEVDIVYPQKTSDLLPQMVLSEKQITQAKEIALEQIKNKKPIVLVGEKGTGKSLFIELLANSVLGTKESIMHVEIKSVSQHTLEQLLTILKQKANANSVILLKGIENTTPTQQAKLYNNIEKINATFAFVLEAHPSYFLENSFKLENQTWKLMEINPIYFHPVRENLNEIDEYIHNLIINYNQKYGKQVVGLRIKALEKLRSHHWEGNFTEMASVIEKLIMHADGAYVDEDDLVLLELDKKLDSKGHIDNDSYVSINIDQTLEEIESDVIHIVLERMQKNKSKTAEHLGMNRATLWRKLKN